MTAARRRVALVAPGSDEHKACKALSSAADEIVLDLEDAVTAASKASARDLVSALVRGHDQLPAVSVRINGRGTAWFEDDLLAAAEISENLTSIVIPKVESVEELIEADRILTASGAANLPVQALIETPQGVVEIDKIVSGPRLSAVIIGYADLGASLGRSRTLAPERWLYVQDRVLHSARAAGVQAIDGPSLNIADDYEFWRAAQWAAELGFDGKWVIHPSQIRTTLKAFTPTEAEIDAAHRVLAALSEAELRGAGAAQLDGRMLDEAIAVAARRTLSKIGD
ncbi:HpcH/HpaI aldolase/citrate lyase family protein [Prescottella agglutinans]|uniref:Citrate lyase beta subunit n=1 Tax=Prescottella agglutinans TaxID=1644129 RepID=A0ABT6MEC9_9NOCA|nr:CoA ester lyase [Prescottella agglutinans]MDH6282637.1 citrate lyase beta subunit [Prescottella agglutinans]